MSATHSAVHDVEPHRYGLANALNDVKTAVFSEPLLHVLDRIQDTHIGFNEAILFDHGPQRYRPVFRESKRLRGQDSNMAGAVGG
jgi:hypothetical protein